MNLGKVSNLGMDNLMSVVRELKVAPEEVIFFLLENPEYNLNEAKRYGIKREKTEKLNNF